MIKLAILASGNGTNAQRISEYFADNTQISVDCIIYNKRNAYVAERAKKLGVPSHYFGRADFYDNGNVLRFLKEHKVTDFAQITVETIKHIDSILHERRVNGQPLRQTSIYGYHKVIRSYIHDAICVGFLQRDPYSSVKIPKGEAREREVLTMDEVQRIQQLKIYNLQMQKVRYMFLVQVFTGLAYADLMATDFTQVTGDTLSGHRVKTAGGICLVDAGNAKRPEDLVDDQRRSFFRNFADQ